MERMYDHGDLPTPVREAVAPWEVVRTSGRREPALGTAAQGCPRHDRATSASHIAQCLDSIKDRENATDARATPPLRPAEIPCPDHLP